MSEYQSLTKILAAVKKNHGLHKDYRLNAISFRSNDTLIEKPYFIRSGDEETLKEACRKPSGCFDKEAFVYLVMYSASHLCEKMPVEKAAVVHGTFVMAADDLADLVQGRKGALRKASKRFAQLGETYKEAKDPFLRYLGEIAALFPCQSHDRVTFENTSHDVRNTLTPIISAFQSAEKKAGLSPSEPSQQKSPQYHCPAAISSGRA